MQLKLLVVISQPVHVSLIWKQSPFSRWYHLCEIAVTVSCCNVTVSMSSNRSFILLFDKGIPNSNGSQTSRKILFSSRRHRSFLHAHTSSPPTSGSNACAPFPALLLALTSSPPSTSGGQECAPFSCSLPHVVLHYRFLLPSYSRGLEYVSRESEKKSVHVSLIWIQSLFSRRCHSCKSAITVSN